MVDCDSLPSKILSRRSLAIQFDTSCGHKCESCRILIFIGDAFPCCPYLLVLSRAARLLACNDQLSTISHVFILTLNLSLLRAVCLIHFHGCHLIGRFKGLWRSPSVSSDMFVLLACFLDVVERPPRAARVAVQGLQITTTTKPPRPWGGTKKFDCCWACWKTMSWITNHLLASVE